MKKIIFSSLILFVFMSLMVFTEEPAPSAPVVKEVGGEWLAYIDYTGPYSDMQKQINAFISEFFGQGLIPMGTSLSLYYNSPENTKPEELKWAFGFIVSPDCSPKAPIKKMELKKQLAVVYLHKGPYENLSKSYELAWKFLKDKGYKEVWPFYDKYLNNPMEVLPKDLETEIVIPVEKNK